LIEFALVLPFLVIVIFGTVDLGRLYQMRNRLANMAREGAVFGSVNPCKITGTPSVTSVALAEDSKNATTTLSSATVTVTLSTDGGTSWSAASNCTTPPAAGTQMRVVVTNPMTILTPVVQTWAGSPVNVTGRIDVAVMG
jgi:Flp pilus assembly protein TadG